MERLSTIHTANDESLTLYKGSHVTKLIEQQQLQARVQELAYEIKNTYIGIKDPLIIISILKGSFIFTSDLCRYLDMPVELEFVSVSSYGDSTESSGILNVALDLSKSIENRHVLIVEDIIDTGLTARYLIDNFLARDPASLKLCALLHKPSRTVHEMNPDFTGFVIENEFVVGYGLDYAGLLRNLPYIGVLHNPW